MGWYDRNFWNFSFEQIHLAELDQVAHKCENVCESFGRAGYLDLFLMETRGILV